MPDGDVTRKPTQTRVLTFDPSTRANDNEIPVVISTDAVVEVIDGPEILVHTRDAVDLSRAPLPIIATHKSNQVNVGIVDGLVVANGKLRGVARFGTRPEAVGYRDDVLAGIIRAVSAGYARIHAMVRADGVLVTDRWMPTHAAMVAEPADIGAGFYRAQGDASPDFVIEREEPAQVTRAAVVAEVPPAEPANHTGAIMAEVITAPAGTSAEPQPTAMEFERQRKEAIINLCKANNIDERVQINWITRGTSLDVIAREILEIAQERSKTETAQSAIGLSRGDTNRFSLFRAIRALHFGARDPKVLQEAAFEIECSSQVAKQLGRGQTSNILVPAEILSRPIAPEAAQRAMATVPGSKGGYMVNVENGGFIEILRNRSVAFRMGARQLSGLTGNLFFPRQTGKSSVTWQGGDGATVTATDQALGQLSMTPKTAIVITDVSEQFLRQANPSAEQFVFADLAAVVAIDGVDNAVINGTGGAQPIGIKNTSGITSSQDASSATYAKILAFVSTAGASNAIRGNPGFVTTTAGAARLMQVQRFTSTDTPVWEGSMLDGSLVGFNAMSSEQLASGNLIFGSWDEVVIGDWGVLELAMDNGGTRFNNGQVGLRALWMVDVMVRYPQAFVVSTNLS